ncbi:MULTISPECIES: PD-(D/E)XK nuclease family protein [unclassified Pseudomonas]|uniref:PD-(D/E)XK nuclease family protein n=1 Tax=unclassified Pseudomonas TaxID=196821 RepID=UPI000B868A14|nr:MULTISPECIES: PD-(D/E)XK nuclease family protein [unclassified Pseudomonas]
MRQNWSEPIPPPLRGGQVVLSERDIETDVPVPMHGRVDQVFLAGGWLVVVDTKRRAAARVYLKDVIQLSVYAAILSRQSQTVLGSNWPVASEGYVRLVTPQGVTYTAVRLLPSSVIISLWNRYWILKGQGAKARPKIPAAGVCKACVKRTGCPVGQRL